MAQKARVRRFWPSFFSPFQALGMGLCLWAPLACLPEFVLNSKKEQPLFYDSSRGVAIKVP